MSRPDIEITYDQIQFDRSDQNTIDQVAEQIFFLAPSDSLMRLHFKQLEGRGLIKVSCRVASTMGLFLAEAEHTEPVKALHLVQAQICKKISEWKERRFAPAQSSPTPFAS